MRIILTSFEPFVMLRLPPRVVIVITITGSGISNTETRIEHDITRGLAELLSQLGSPCPTLVTKLLHLLQCCRRGLSFLQLFSGIGVYRPIIFFSLAISLTSLTDHIVGSASFVWCHGNSVSLLISRLLVYDARSEGRPAGICWKRRLIHRHARYVQRGALCDNEACRCCVGGIQGGRCHVSTIRGGRYRDLAYLLCCGTRWGDGLGRQVNIPMVLIVNKKKRTCAA